MREKRAVEEEPFMLCLLEIVRQDIGVTTALA